MLRIGHYGVNAVLYAPIGIGIAAVTNDVNVAAVAGLVVIGLASFPDIDLRLPFITHRGITHTIWFAFFVGFFIGGAYSSIPVETPVEGVRFLIGFLLGVTGITGHLLGDVLTPMGIKPFAPVRDTEYSLSWFNANSILANAGIAFLGVVVLSSAAYVTLVITGNIHSDVMMQTPSSLISKVVVHG